ncbi:soluble quino protein glucose/sorbosone dehydrogenase [Lasiosphaeris hirsuta]|uniref:Soluble quino protein glucose/sorbosone dehydrogenase n=1 Tax=Lasiosphaeris hirsuta TaxID=260670 RepID=A0AA40AID4_9PEZI|nr:soluble quino protein glucose/sorbosone dehydrogenase [Lasiosphaeris hirsuta]
MHWLATTLSATLVVFGSAYAEPESKVVARQTTPLPFPASCSGVTARTNYKLSVADGWKYTLIASGLSTPRSVLFDTEGHLLVLQAGLGLTAHSIGADGCISSSKTLIENKQLNHGLALSPDGKTVYVSASPTAWSYTYDPVALTATNQKVVVKGMNPGGHSSRTLAVPPNNPNLLIVSLGSNDNIDMLSAQKETGRAIVKVFDLSKTPSGGWTYNSQGWYLGYGLRNEIAIVFDGNNMVWGIENSGDQLTRAVTGSRSIDVHIDNPAEELNYLGDPSQSNEQWYGYPTCWTVGDPGAIADRTFQIGQQFMVTPNATFNDETCAQKSVPPRLSMRAHSAPIDGKFDRDYRNLYVSLHGSWNRQPATGYKVIQIPFTQLASGAYDPVAPADSPFTKGYSDILWTQNEGGCASNTCLRPTGITWHPDGSRMYIASDGSVGELYILYKA